MRAILICTILFVIVISYFLATRVYGVNVANEIGYFIDKLIDGYYF